MLGVNWDKIDERYYEHGLDRGTLYIAGLDPLAWNGFTGLDEGAAGATSMLYHDGQVYLADADPSDFEAKITCWSFPQEFRACFGMREAGPGMIVDNQKPLRFGFSYRSLVGSGMHGDKFGYQIHLVYNAFATIGTRSRETRGQSPKPMDFNFDIVCTPVKLAGYRPTAHYVLDTRGMTAEKLAELEAILYGTSYGTGEDIITEPLEDPIPGSTVGRLPTPSELLAIVTAA